MLSAEAPVGRRPAGPAARALTLAALAAAAAAALALAACGSEDAGAPVASGATELSVTLDADGGGGDPPLTERVSCGEGPGCAAAAELEVADFEPVPADTACTEIYGGPDRVAIEGTLRGEPVAAELTRANGCEIDRFDRFADLLDALFPGYEPGASLTG